MKCIKLDFYVSYEKEQCTIFDRVTNRLCNTAVLKFLENSSSLNYEDVDDTDVKIVGWLLDSYYPGGLVAKRENC